MRYMAYNQSILNTLIEYIQYTDSVKLTDGRVVAKGLIMRNPAVTRKGDESHRNELLGSDRGLLGCSYCGAVECGTKKMI